MVRSDTVPVLGRNLQFEIIKSKKTVPLLAKMMNLDSRTIYKSIKSENVAPNVVKKFSEFFKLPVSFFTNFIKDGDLYLKEIKSWKDYSINTQFDRDYNYELKFSANLTKSEFSIYNDLIRKFLKELNKMISFHSNDNSKLDRFHQLDSYASFLELSSLGEELNNNNISVYFSRYRFWINEHFDLSGEPLFNYYQSYNKQHLLFTDVANKDYYFTSLNIGEIPPNPYEIFKNDPNAESIEINDYKYRKDEFKSFWGSGFKERRDKIDDEFITEIINEIGYDVGEIIASRSPEYKSIDDVVASQSKENLLSLLKSRDLDIKNVNQEEKATEEINKKKDKNKLYDK